MVREPLPDAMPLALYSSPLRVAWIVSHCALHENMKSTVPVPSVPGAQDQRGCPFQLFTFPIGSRQPSFTARIERPSSI